MNEKNRKKQKILIKIFTFVTLILMILMLFATFAFSYELNLSKNMTLIVTPTQVGVGEGANFQWFNTTDYSTHLIPVNTTVTIADSNITNYTENFNDLYRRLIDNLPSKISNLSLSPNFQSEITNSVQNSVNNTVQSAVNSALSTTENGIVGRINSNVDIKCNYEQYSNFVKDFYNNNILPNVTAYNSLVEDRDACKKSLMQCNNDLQQSRIDYKNLDGEYTWLMWTALFLFLLILFILYLDYGSMGFDVFRRLRWKKRERVNINTSTYKEKQPNITVSGTELLKREEEE